MFATMRRKSRSTKMKNELGQSVDHFKRAASLAAQETSATVGPKFNAARDRVQPAAVKAKDAASSSWDSALATLTPLVTAATENARQAGKASKKQAPQGQPRRTRRRTPRSSRSAPTRRWAASRSGRKGTKLAGLRWSAPRSVSRAAYVVQASQGRAVGRVRARRPVTSTRRSPGPTTPRSSRHRSGPSSVVTPTTRRLGRRAAAPTGRPATDGAPKPDDLERWTRRGRQIGAAQPEGRPDGRRSEQELTSVTQLRRRVGASTAHPPRACRLASASRPGGRGPDPAPGPGAAARPAGPGSGAG